LGVGIACAVITYTFAIAGMFMYDEKTAPRAAAYTLWAISALFGVPLLTRLWLALVLG
jgi:hypothetical protein